MAIAHVELDGFEAWITPALSSLTSTDVAPLKGLVHRGLTELSALHCIYGVK